MARFSTVAWSSVARSLRVSGASTSVVLSAYFVAYAMPLLPGGMLVDRFGARRLALFGLELFALGAGAGAVASGLGVPAATRGAGAGAGLVCSGAVSGFPAARRGNALRPWAAGHAFVVPSTSSKEE